MAEYKLPLTGQQIEEKLMKIDKKADVENSVFTGSISMGRKPNTVVGERSVATGNNVEASNSNSHAEGYETKASGDCSHAEGFKTRALGSCSHAEGNSTVTYGEFSHAEGCFCAASISNSHAEGYETKASGDCSHSEGFKTRALGDCSHAEGNTTSTFGEFSHAEGGFTTASGNFSHAEGNSTKVSGNFSHAEGAGTTVSGSCSHAEGFKTTASGDNSHVEGSFCEASNSNSHAEGYSTKASGDCSHAEGFKTTASSSCSHAEGNSTTTSGEFSHAEGYSTKASGNCSHVQGKFNIEDTENKYAHIVGNGTGESNKTNAHTLDWQGNTWYQGSVTSNGADYAEFFEWQDGNPDNEDRVGLLVTLDGDKIKLANIGDNIIGIISGTVAVLGDNYECEWNGKYLTDDFGRIIYDEVEEFIDAIIGIDEETNEPITEKKSLGLFKHPRINPDYDPEQEYINRSNRPEWDTVGMIGKLYLRDDGTCEVNGYVKAGENGVGTASETKTNIRVLKRINTNIIKVLKM